MARGSMVLAVLATMFISSGAPGAATVQREAPARGVARTDHRSEAETRALDHLLERSGLGVQLESLSLGVRAQFLHGHRRLNSQDRGRRVRIVPGPFAPQPPSPGTRLESLGNLESATLQKQPSWQGSRLGKRLIGLVLAR